ncbi:MAG: hypothetical protein ACJAQZ_001638 [Planctomycetota bacterium]|jgi:hypothetical protein
MSSTSLHDDEGLGVRASEHVPMALVPNAGQWPEHVRFSTASGRVWVERDALVLSRPLPAGREQVIRLRVLDAAAGMQPEGAHAAAGRHSFFLDSNADAWRTDLVAYDLVCWPSIRAGVDLLVRTGGAAPEYLLELSPGADLAGVRMQCEGVTDLKIDAEGALHMKSSAGDLVQSPPVAWHVTENGEQRYVAIKFRKIDKHTFGFVAPTASATKALSVDPVLQWSTFVGGSNNEWGYATSRAPDGSVVVTGQTTSSNFPTTAGVIDPSYNGFGAPTTDVFVVRIQAGGAGVLYATYLGGSGSEKGLGVSVDAAGVATVVGAAGSSNFPTTAGAYSTSLSGSNDAFVSRISADGTTLLFSTLFGGNGSEHAEDVAVGNGGDVWITGVTSSSSFPTTSGAWSSVRQGASDVFVAHLSANGSSLLGSTLLGGTSSEVGLGIAVTPSGDGVVGGVTSSADFPTTALAFQSTLLGTSDAFCVRIDGSCQTLLMSTLVGGGSGDVGETVAVSLGGLAMVAGVTSSNNFPTSPGAYQSVSNGSSDAFVAAFDAQGQRVWATLVVGSNGDVGKSLSVTEAGTVVLGGQCSSSSFPTTPGAVLSSGSGAADAFVVHLAADGSGMLAGTLFGGSGSDGGEGIDGRVPSEVALTGVTNSNNMPVTAGAWSPAQLGTNDAFSTVLDMRAPGVVRYGVPTAGCAGSSRASVGRWPEAGATDFSLQCTQAPPLTLGVLVIGFAPAPGFPVLGVQAYVDLLQPTVLLTAFSDLHGMSRVLLSLAAVPPASQLFVQFAWFNPPGCGTAFQLGASDALDITVQ